MNRATPGLRRKPAGPPARFFLYGTLLDPDIQRRVLGQALPPARVAAASLGGVRRVRAAGRWFPMLVPGSGGRVAGIAVHGFSRTQIAQLVAYEWPAYRLAEVQVRLHTGRRVGAWTFLPVKGLRPTAEPWELAAWQRDVKPRVLRLVP